MSKQKPLDKKKLLEKYGDTLVETKEFEEAVTRMAQSKPRRVRKKKGD